MESQDERDCEEVLAIDKLVHLKNEGAKANVEVVDADPDIKLNLPYLEDIKVDTEVPKSIKTIMVPTTLESQDEPERAALTDGKMVQAKNGVGAKANDANIETKINLLYREDITVDTEVPKPIKTIMVPTTVESQGEPDRAALTDGKMVQAKNEVGAKANDANIETKINLLYREDITVDTEVPKPIKTIMVPTTVESQGEPDRAALTDGKMVQAKNEVGAKANDANIETEINLLYREDITVDTEVPKPIKTIMVPTTVESQGEPDRAALTDGKMVQAKNEVGAIANDANIETEINLLYREDITVVPKPIKTIMVPTTVESQGEPDRAALTDGKMVQAKNEVGAIANDANIETEINLLYREDITVDTEVLKPIKTIMVPTTVESQGEPDRAALTDGKMVQAKNEVGAKANDANIETKINLLYREDITVDTEVPKPIKTIMVPTTVESQGEPDRAALTDGKMVQAKNEVGAKANDANIETEINLLYREDITVDTEVPKPIKTIMVPTTVESQGEADRAALTDGKMVQAKNEVGAIANDANIETEINLLYREDITVVPKPIKTIMVPTTVESQGEPDRAALTDGKMVQAKNEVGAIANDANIETEINLLYREDITVDTEVLKPIKTIMVPTTVESQGEPDRAALTDGKMVQAKNEVGAKANDANIETKINLLYREDITVDTEVPKPIKTIMVPTTVESQDQPDRAALTDGKMVQGKNEVGAIANDANIETKINLLYREDITVDTEVPKPIKTIMVPTTVESQGEPDRAALTDGKMVQAKNEVGAKANDANIETKINLLYREDITVDTEVLKPIKTIMVPTTVESQGEPDRAALTDGKMVQAKKEVGAIANDANIETEINLLYREDITVDTEVLKPIKTIMVPTTVESQGEPDRAALTDGKMVQAKNEVGAKANDANIETKINLLYREDITVDTEVPKPIKTIMVPTTVESQDQPDRAALTDGKMVQGKNEVGAIANDANIETKINLLYREDITVDTEVPKPIKTIMVPTTVESQGEPDRAALTDGKMVQAKNEVGAIANDANIETEINLLYREDITVVPKPIKTIMVPTTVESQGEPDRAALTDGKMVQAKNEVGAIANDANIETEINLLYREDITVDTEVLKPIKTIMVPTTVESQGEPDRAALTDGRMVQAKNEVGAKANDANIETKINLLYREDITVDTEVPKPIKTIMVPTTVESQNQPDRAALTDGKMVQGKNEVGAIANDANIETKINLLYREDITVDTEVPKPIKTIMVPTTVESQGEPDRAALTDGKMVQAKNEVGAKANDANIETKINLLYREDITVDTEVPKPIKTIMVPTTVESQGEPDRAALTDGKMVQAKNEVGAKANDANIETKINLLYREDFTVDTEVPKPIKTIMVPTTVESQDEPDRAPLTDGKMVQAKNEVGAKANDANIETKINLLYREDQWSPFNKNGKKVYDRDFLLALRKDPKSNKKPDNILPNILANEDRERIGDISRFAVGGKANGLVLNKNSKQRGAPPKPKSQKSSKNKASKNLQEPENEWGLPNVTKVVKSEQPMMDEPSGSIQMFGNWSRGSNTKTAQPPLTNTASMYAALEDQDCNVYHTTYNLEPTSEKLNPNQLDYQLRSKIKEYLLRRCSIKECDRYIQTSISPSDLPGLASIGYFFLKSSKKFRFQIGFLFAHLIKVNILSLTDYCIGLEDVLEEANKLNRPSVWNDVAELICAVLCEDSETPENFQNVFELVMSKDYSSKLLFSLLIVIIEEKGNTFVFDDFSINTPSIINSENLENESNNILEEYLNGHCNTKQCDQYIKDSISPSALPKLVSDGYMSVLEKSKMDRLQTGFLFAELMQWGTLSLQSYCVGLATVLEEANEFIFDVPSIWDDVAELIYPVLCETAKSSKHLHQLFDLLTKNHAMKLLSCLFKIIIQKKSPNLQSSWKSSDFSVVDFMFGSRNCDEENGLASLLEVYEDNEEYEYNNKLRNYGYGSSEDEFF